MSAWESTDDALVSLPALIQRIRDVIEAQTVARCSKYVIDHSGNTPSHLVDDTFSLDLQSENTGKYREDSAIRAGHSLTVTCLRKLRPQDQFASQLDGLRREEEIMRALSERVATAEIRVVFRNTTRALSPTREYSITRLTFSIEHDWWDQPMNTET